jgi:hypothetical protein
VGGAFTAEERALLLRAYGVDDPARLYLPDSAPGAILRYDLRVVPPSGGGRELTVRVGYPSGRRADESWDRFAARVLRTPPPAFGPPPPASRSPASTGSTRTRGPASRRCSPTPSGRASPCA